MLDESFPEAPVAPVESRAVKVDDDCAEDAMLADDGDAGRPDPKFVPVKLDIIWLIFSGE